MDAQSTTTVISGWKYLPSQPRQLYLGENTCPVNHDSYIWVKILAQSTTTVISGWKYLPSQPRQLYLGENTCPVNHDSYIWMKILAQSTTTVISGWKYLPSQPRQLYLGENTIRTQWTPKILTCFVMLKLVHCQFKKHWQSVGKTKTPPKSNDIIIIFPGRKDRVSLCQGGQELVGIYIYMYVDNKRDFTNPVVSSVMCHWLCPCYLRYHKQIILAVLECRTLI